MMRRALSPIALRLLLFNVLLVFLPVAGLLSLESLERQMLALQERSLVQQGRIAAAALGGSNALDGSSARALVQRLERRSEARVRIVDREGRVVADSASSRPAAIETEASPYAPAQPQVRERPLYRIGVRLWQLLEGIRELFRGEKTRGTLDRANVTPRDAVARALAGSYGATVRISTGQRSLTMYSALPIPGGGDGAVVGAVMVSQSTSRILRALWRVRLETFQVFAISIAAAIVLSLLVSATIARPLIRLRDEADALLDHRGRLRRTFRGSKRRDEIGDLARALAQLTARLERHLTFVESVSADVSHEFKNPLASIRNAAELLPQTVDERDRKQLTATIEKEVARLTRLVNAVREVSKVDAAVDMEAAAPTDLGVLLRELTNGRPVALAVPADALLVMASEDRLAQAFENVIDNAVSFSPADREVEVAIGEVNGEAVVRIDDRGAGIPPEHLDRVFDRFFSYRPGGGSENHDGLGLAIARAVIEGYGGSIRALNLQPHGTRVEVRLPLARH